MSLHRCSSCGKMKQRIKTDRKYDTRNVYVDETGRTWRGSRCRDCLTRSASSLIVERLTSRSCNMCGTKLPESRRFNCKECVKPDDYSLEHDNYIYHINT